MATAAWAKESEIIRGYVDTAKTYIQLSSGGLALPLILTEKLRRDGMNAVAMTGAAWYVVVSTWAAFLVAVVSGAFFQFAAAKFVEREIDPNAYLPGVFAWVVERGPGQLLNVTVLSFVIGAIGVVVYSSLLLGS